MQSVILLKAYLMFIFGVGIGNLYMYFERHSTVSLLLGFAIIITAVALSSSISREIKVKRK